MNDTEVLLLSKKDLYQYFHMQWKSHSEDQRLGHWTNMRLVGVEADGAFSSVQVSQILVLRYISIFYDFSLQVHQAIIFPLCENLSEAATDGGQEDLVILLPDTPSELRPAGPHRPD